VAGHHGWQGHGTVPSTSTAGSLVRSAEESKLRAADGNLKAPAPVERAPAHEEGHVVGTRMVFISYSHKDEIWKDRLRSHLKVLEQAGRITVWDDREIEYGTDWHASIRKAIDQAAVTVCLISADYLASEFCTKEEVPYLLARRKRDEMVLIPVLLRPCAWSSAPWLRASQMLPRDGKALCKDFPEQWDAIFSEVADRVSQALQRVHSWTPLPSDTLDPNDVSTVRERPLFPRRAGRASPRRTVWVSAAGLLTVMLVAGAIVVSERTCIQWPWSRTSLTAAEKGKVASLLEAAKVYVEVRRFFGPPGANALEAFEEVLQIDPNNCQAKNGLEELESRRADANLHMGRLEGK
jgi:hypothetical protein